MKGVINYLFNGPDLPKNKKAKKVWGYVLVVLLISVIGAPILLGIESFVAKKRADLDFIFQQTCISPYDTSQCLERRLKATLARENYEHQIQSINKEE